MRLKTLTAEKVSPAKMILIYGETGVGKTVSTLKSLKKPILMFKFEGRDITEPVKLAKLKEGDIFIYDFVNWEGLMDFLGNPTEEELKVIDECKSVLFDNVTYLMNNLLAWEIQDETFEALGKEYKHFRPMVDSTRMGMDGYGALASKMSRMFKLTTERFISKGKSVIFTALLKENPKYNRALSAAPNFTGKMLADDLPSFFDLIGKVESRYDENGNIVYPPLVKFAPIGSGEDGMFMCKWTGNPNGKKWGVLDFSNL